MAGFIKKTTGLTGLAADPLAPQVKTRAHQTVFGQSSSTIFQSVVKKTGDVDTPPASHPSESSLTRTANRVRKESRPSDPVDLNFEKLQRLYKATLKALGSMPGSYPYRRSTEQLINDRLNIIQTESDPVQVEKKINSGQLEELVLQAEREFHLAKNMLIWKTWEPLIEEAPKNQWKWPV